VSSELRPRLLSPRSVAAQDPDLPTPRGQGRSDAPPQASVPAGDDADTPVKVDVQVARDEGVGVPTEAAPVKGEHHGSVEQGVKHERE
jgi:hypothetical protein